MTHTDFVYRIISGLSQRNLLWCDCVRHRLWKRYQIKSYPYVWRN